MEVLAILSKKRRVLKSQIVYILQDVCSWLIENMNKTSSSIYHNWNMGQKNVENY